jgi:hypothetical protein
MESESISTKDQYQQKIEEILSSKDKPEEKIEALLAVMKACISQEDSPLFKSFWEARKAMIPLFKEITSSYARSTFWKQMMELTDQAKKIRDILDEKSTFHVEQIDLAIEAIEKDLSIYDQKLQEMPQPEFSHSLLQKSEWHEMQKELDLLDTLAQRLSALRKEILSTEMRMKHKNALLKKMSDLQDQVLPKRRDYMARISEKYINLVEQFEERHFADQTEKKPFFALKDQIRKLQADGKRLTLVPKIFARGRVILSRCWDKVMEKQLEVKEKKKQLVAEDEKHFPEIEQKISQLKAESEKSEQPEQVKKSITATISWLKSLKLSKDSYRRFADQIDQIKKEVSQKQKQFLEEKAIKAKEIQQKIKDFLQDKHSLQEITAFIETVKQEIEKNNLTEEQADHISYDLIQVQEQKEEAEEEELLQNDPSKVDAVLEKKEARSKQIKTRIEELKQKINRSNLDFSKAMVLREMLDDEKKRLDALMQQITSLE